MSSRTSYASIDIKAAVYVGLAAALIACAGTARAQDAAAEFADNDFLGEQTVRGMFEPEDFSLGFGLVLPAAGGTIAPAIRETAPVLGALTVGVGHVLYNFEPCGVVLPHVHPRGDESIFAVSGTLDAGFVDEAGVLIRHEDITEGTAFVIPQGYIHYIANPTCEPAKGLATNPTSDGGVYGALPSVLGLPANILQAFTPSVSLEAIEALRGAVAAAGSIAIDAACAARCAEGGNGSYGM